MSQREPADHGASVYHGGFAPPVPTDPAGGTFPNLPYINKQAQQSLNRANNAYKGLQKERQKPVPTLPPVDLFPKHRSHG